MSERKLDPQTLAERLDAVLQPGQFDAPSGDEEPLVNAALRVAAVPQPESMTPAAKARIRSQVLKSHREQIRDASAPSQSITTTWWMWVGVIVLMAIIGGLALARMSQERVIPASVTTEEATPTDTATPISSTSTPVEPTPTSGHTSTPAEPTPTPELTSTPVEPTPTPVESTPEVIPSADNSLPTLVIIEGPVEAIDANIVTAFGMDIMVDPDDPILTALQPGDQIRVEGNIDISEESTVIVATSIVITNIDAVISDEPVEQPGAPIVVPPGCKITGIGNNNPRLKCSNP